MPLIKSSSKKAVSENIRRERRAGKPQAQAIAIAMSVARRARKKKYADGGEVDAPLWLESGMMETPPPPLATASKQSAEWRTQRMRRMGPAEPMEPEDAISMATWPVGGPMVRAGLTGAKVAGRALTSLPTSSRAAAASGVAGAASMPFLSDQAAGAPKARVAAAVPVEPDPPARTGNYEEDIKARLNWIDAVGKFHANTRTPSAAGTQKARVDALNAERDRLVRELAAIQHEKKPFVEKFPESKYAMPAAVLGSGVANALLATRGKPLKSMMWGAGTGAGLSGAVGAGPTIYEASPFQSEGPVKAAAQKRVGDVENFWLRSVLPESALGGVSGALGGAYGAKTKEVIGNAATGAANLFRRRTVPLGSSPAAAEGAIPQISRPSVDSLGRSIRKRPDGKWEYGNHRFVSQDELKALRTQYPDMASGGRVRLPRPRPWEGGGFAPESDPPPWVAGFPREELRRPNPIPLPRSRPQFEEDIPLPRARPPDMTIDMEPEAFPGPIEGAPSSQPAPSPRLARSPLPLGGTTESRSAPGVDIDPIISSIPQMRLLRTLRNLPPPPYQPAPRAEAPTLRFESMNPMRGQPRGPDGRFRRRRYEFDGMAAGGSIGGREWAGGLMSQQTLHDRLKSQEDDMERSQLRSNGPVEDSSAYYWQNPSEDTNPYTAHRREQRLALGGSPRIPSVPSAGKAQFQPFTGGLINSSVPGRTDKINMKVPAGSYVVPSSVVSHLGQDNTMAGSGVLDSMFKPASSRNVGQSARIRSGRPYRIRRKRADGGPVDDVPIIAAGGEYVILPEQLMERFGDLDRGHKIMDEFVKQTRQQHIKTLKNLPGPEK